MNALHLQLEKALISLGEQKIETLFIGGGTPSCVPANEYGKLFLSLQPYLAPNAEITTEANPNSATSSWLQSMFDYGVNRISFGVQSFNDEKLQFLGRSHNQKKAIAAIQEAQTIGFEKINCDLIYGVQNDTQTLLQKDIDSIKDLNVTHVSAYSLTLEEHTPFYGKSHVKIDDEILSAQLFKMLEKAGFKQYEISNFAQHESFQSRHNLGYWQHKAYLGIGAGAVGYAHKKRYYMPKEIQAYIKNPYFYETEVLSDEDIKVEKVLLGFRSIVGVEMSLFTQAQLNKIQLLLENKKLFQVNEKIYNYNFLLADELALYVLE
jgi:oxygen-independent coproporphyrinogen-3 oxidase